MSPRSKNFLILGLIIGVFVAFALAGRFLIDPSEMARTNRGTLIIPHIPIAGLALESLEGETWAAEDMAGQWTLMYLAGSECGEGCRNALFYLMHRLRQSLGRDSERLRLVLVHTRPPSAELRQFTEEKIDRLVELRADAKTVRQALAPAFGKGTDPLRHLYLVAPDGQIFMWYPTHEEMQEVLREADNIHHDLTRTLKGSLSG